MRKLLFAGFIWEVIRFLYMYIFAYATPNSDLFIWMNAQQIVTLFGMFFLFYNFVKYKQYTKLMLVAKLFGVLADFIFIFKLSSTSGAITLASLMIPGIALVLDLFFGGFLFITARHLEDEQ